jgi:hypothetical protein
MTLLLKFVKERKKSTKKNQNVKHENLMVNLK